MRGLVLHAVFGPSRFQRGVLAAPSVRQATEARRGDHSPHRLTAGGLSFRCQPSRRSGNPSGRETAPSRAEAFGDFNLKAASGLPAEKQKASGLKRNSFWVEEHKTRRALRGLLGLGVRKDVPRCVLFFSTFLCFLTRGLHRSDGIPSDGLRWLKSKQQEALEGVVWASLRGCALVKD